MFQVELLFLHRMGKAIQTNTSRLSVVLLVERERFMRSEKRLINKCNEADRAAHGK